jgi:hypothetical protein
MDHIAGRLAAASLSSDDPSASAAGRDSGVSNLRGIMSAVERAEGTIRDKVSPPSSLLELLRLYILPRSLSLAVPGGALNRSPTT